jgi:hypothetical protein
MSIDELTIRRAVKMREDLIAAEALEDIKMGLIESEKTTDRHRKQLRRDLVKLRFRITEQIEALLDLYDACEGLHELSDREKQVKLFEGATNERHQQIAQVGTRRNQKTREESQGA